MELIYKWIEALKWNRYRMQDKPFYINVKCELWDFQLVRLGLMFWVNFGIVKKKFFECKDKDDKIWHYINVYFHISGIGISMGLPCDSRFKTVMGRR